MIYRELFYFSLTACLLCVDFTAGGLSLHLLSAPLTTAFLLSWLTCLLPSRIRPAIQIILGECLIVLCLIDCYCQLYLGSPINPQILSTIIESDYREAKEFLSVFISYHVLFQWRITCLLLMAALFPFSYLIKYRHGRQGWKFGMAVLFAICFAYEIPSLYKYLQLFGTGTDLQRMEGLIFQHYHEEVPTPVHRFGFAYYAARQSDHMLDAIKHSTYSADIDSCSHLSPHIVLIIGESYNKHHSSLYGYHLETTPLQQKRMENGELFLFGDVATPWNITSNAFIEMFSLWENGCKSPIGNYPLFPILFRRSGYTVTFFSNQYLLKGFHRGITNQAGHFFLVNKELSDSLFCYRNRKSNLFDMGIVNQVASYKNEHPKQNYTLDIVHLIGQHFDYSKRYPQSQAKFSQTDYANKRVSNEAKQTIMHYDNATHYNDMVLDSLLSLYEKEEAIILFVSDHGEEVYDSLPVHGRLFQEPTAIQAQQEFEIPMWIWCSENYQNKHPEVVSQIRESLQKPFMTDGIPQILLWLAGIKCRWTNENRNLLSPHYQCKKRIIVGTTDYDCLMRSIK